MEPAYQPSNALAQQKYIRQQEEQRGSIAGSAVTSASTVHEVNTIKTTILEIPNRFTNDAATPGTSMDALVGPVTESELAGRDAVARQRALMEGRLRRHPSPLRSPAKGRPTYVNPLQSNKTNKPWRSNSTRDSKEASNTQFFATWLRGKRSRPNLQESRSTSNTSDEPLPSATSSNSTADREKPLPTLIHPAYVPQPLQRQQYQPVTVAFALPLPSSSPRAPTPSSPALTVTQSSPPKLDPKASPFHPGQDWPLPDTIKLVPPHNATSDALASQHAHPARQLPPSPTSSDIARPYSTTVSARSKNHASPSSPTPLPKRKYRLLHPQAMIASTMGPTQAGNNGAPQYITPTTDGSYGTAGQVVLVQNGGIPHGVSVKGSIFDVGDLDGPVELEGGQVSHLGATVTQDRSCVLEEVEEDGHEAADGGNEEQPKQESVTMCLSVPSPTATADGNGFSLAAGSPTSIYSPWPPLRQKTIITSSPIRETRSGSGTPTRRSVSQKNSPSSRLHTHLNNLHAHITNLEQFCTSRLTTIEQNGLHVQNTSLARIEAKLDALNIAVRQIVPRVDSIEQKVDLMEDKLDVFSGRMEDVELRFHGVERAINEVSGKVGDAAEAVQYAIGRVNRVSAKIDGVETKVRVLNEKFDKAENRARIDESFRVGRYPGQGGKNWGF